MTTERLTDDKEHIILPTPAFAEFLVLAGSDAPQYISAIRDNSIFRIYPFDEIAAIELADMEIESRRKWGSKKGAASDSEWQKVKFDRQIVAIAKAHGATVIYSDDPHIAKHGEDCGVKVISLADLPVPAAVQLPLAPIESNEQSPPVE